MSWLQVRKAQPIQPSPPLASSTKRHSLRRANGEKICMHGLTNLFALFQFVYHEPLLGLFCIVQNHLELVCCPADNLPLDIVREFDDGTLLRTQRLRRFLVVTAIDLPLAPPM